MTRSTAIRSWLRKTAGAVALLATCAAACGPLVAAEEPPHPASLDAAIIAAAQRHGVPEHLVRRIIMRESRYNPLARNHKYWGLMQISYPTARSMGFKGTPEQLLNPVTNLRYAVPYLANAFVAAGKREDGAVRLYAAGYWDTVKRRGLIDSLRTADSAPAPGFHDEVQIAAAEPPPAPSYGVFGALFGSSEPAAVAQPAPITNAGDVPSLVAIAPPAAPQIASSRVAQSSDKGSTKGGGGSVAMVAGGNGQAAPPKTWKHDGGVTIIARGEQGVERFAAYAEGQSQASTRRTATHHARKSTEFASLDTPASAQAYAASDGSVAAPPQAAISQAMSAPAAAPTDPSVQQATYAPAPAGAQEAAAATAAADAANEAETPAPKKHRKVASKHHAVAKADATPPAAVAELRQ